MDEQTRQAMNEISEAVAEAVQEIGEAINKSLVELAVLKLRCDLDYWHLTAN